MPPIALILRTAGTNCDQELAYGFELAGATARVVHLNELIADPSPLEQCDLIGLPGGFSYGDDISAGRIFANRLRHQLWQPLSAAVARGVGLIGICNGFQVLVKLGLLPDPHAGQQTVTLAENSNGRFLDRWVELELEAPERCMWTQGLAASIELPIAHAEGRLTASEATLDQLEAGGQVVLRYAAGDNPNGSERRIAGLSDPSGRIFGLMPHPERCVTPEHPPAGLGRQAGDGPLGLRMFQSAVSRVDATPRPHSHAAT